MAFSSPEDPRLRLASGDRAPTARSAHAERDAELRRAVEISAREWQRTVDTLDSPVLVMELDGRIRRLNRAAAKLLDRRFSDAIGATLPELSEAEPWASAAGVLAACRDRLAGERLQCPDDAGRTWEVVATVSRRGGPAWVVLVLHDLTERVALEERLRRTEVMSALGSLVAGVAHEARNPLFGISAALDAFVARFGEDARFAPYIDVLQGEVARLRDLVQNLFEYGKAPSRALAPGPVEPLLEEAAGAAAGLAEAHEVALALHVDLRLPPVLLNGGRLSYVFNNLIQNAVQHSPPGATVEVEAVPDGERAGSGIRCSVRDRGPGIEPEDLPRIFEPFFSRRRGGLGLGLAIAHRIVEEHGGTLRARNHPDGGAELVLWLPSVTHGAGSAARSAEALPS